MDAGGVRRLQGWLRGLGLYRGAVDGAAGALTLAGADALIAALPAVPAAAPGWPAQRRLVLALSLLERLEPRPPAAPVGVAGNQAESRLVAAMRSAGSP
ncbi:MAG: hypothetical protein AAFR52_19030 [Pseudomonadota bacterium]